VKILSGNNLDGNMGSFAIHLLRCKTDETKSTNKIAGLTTWMKDKQQDYANRQVWSATNHEEASTLSPRHCGGGALELKRLIASLSQVSTVSFPPIDDLLAGVLLRLESRMGGLESVFRRVAVLSSLTRNSESGILPALQFNV